MNELLGIRGKSFDRFHGEDIDNMRRLWYDYCQKASSHLNANTQSSNLTPEMHIKIADNGFPAICNAPKEIEKLHRKILQMIYRDYVNAHYRGLFLYVQGTD